MEEYKQFTEDEIGYIFRAMIACAVNGPRDSRYNDLMRLAESDSWSAPLAKGLFMDIPARQLSSTIPELANDIDDAVKCFQVDLLADDSSEDVVEVPDEALLSRIAWVRGLDVTILGSRAALEQYFSTYPDDPTEPVLAAVWSMPGAIYRLSTGQYPCTPAPTVTAPREFDSTCGIVLDALGYALKNFERKKVDPLPFLRTLPRFMHDSFGPQCEALTFYDSLQKDAEIQWETLKAEHLLELLEYWWEAARHLGRLRTPLPEGSVSDPTARRWVKGYALTLVNDIVDPEQEVTEEMFCAASSVWRRGLWLKFKDRVPDTRHPFAEDRPRTPFLEYEADHVDYGEALAHMNSGAKA